MIPKGNQRGGGQQLAAHLLNTFDNDQVELADLRGAVAPDLAGAFSEWHATAKSTSCKKYLYSLSLNPDQQQRRLSREEYFDFIRRAEAKLKLENQPRAVVFHVKHGREHCHVVWSRIDAANARAVAMSHDHQKLRRVAQEFAKEHGLELPNSMKKDRGRDRFEDQKKIADLGEKQQQERTGFDKTDRMQIINDAWLKSDTGGDFVRLLAEKDYYLARGDRRGYVVVDLAGEVHSLGRQIKGINSKQLKERLSILPPDKLPGIERAQEFAKGVRETMQRQREREREASRGPTPDDRREQLRKQQEVRRVVIEKTREDMRYRHAAELGKLTIRQANVNAKVAQRRKEIQEDGWMKMVGKFVSWDKFLAPVYKYTDKMREQRQKDKLQQMQERQARELRDNDRQMAAAKRIENREAKSLETTLRREEFQRIANPGKAKQNEGKGKSRPPEKEIPKLQPAPDLRREFETAARPPVTKAPAPARKPGRLTELFGRQARPALEAARQIDKQSLQPAPPEPAQEPMPQSSEPGPSGGRFDTLRAAFAEAAKGNTEPTVEQGGSGRSPGSLSDRFNRGAGGAQDGVNQGPEKHYRRQSAPDYSVRR